MLDVKGLKDLEIWLRLFAVDNTGFTSKRFVSLWEIAKQIERNPNAYILTVVKKAFELHLIKKTDGYFVIDTDALSDALSEISIYPYFKALISYNSI